MQGPDTMKRIKAGNTEAEKRRQILVKQVHINTASINKIINEEITFP